MGRLPKSKNLSKKDREEVESYLSSKESNTMVKTATLLSCNRPTSKCLNEKQGELKRLIKDKNIIITSGPAGTGKTYVALQTAFNILCDNNNECIDKIVLAKSVTTIKKEEIGFLPGTLEEKMEPFMISYMANINKIFKCDIAKKLLAEKTIEYQPLAYIRGIQYDNAIVIVDEAQNIDMNTFKSIITRLGKNSKMIFLGDTEQIDREKTSESCLSKIINIFNNDGVIGVLEFGDSDCVRNPNIPHILNKLRDNGF